MPLNRRLSACLFACLAALALTQIPARADAPPTYSYAYLKDMRAAGQLPKFPDYTLDQQKLVLGQVKLLLLQMYVHLQLKKDVFPRTAQPEAKLKTLGDLLDTRTTAMDQTAFHTALINLFVNERDLHTIYELPTPYACYGTGLPFTIDRVRDPVTKKTLLAISKITVTQGMIDHAPGLAKLSVGDIIEKYDGKDPVAQLSRIDADPGVAVELLGSGANEAARARRASEKLTYLSQSMDLFPKDPGDKVQLHIRKQDGTPLDISFPWIVIGIQSCLHPAPTPAPTAGGKAPRSTEEYETRYQEFHKPRAVSPNAAILGQDPKLDLSAPTATDESILHYKVLTRQDQGQPDRQFGYLRLDSFEPTLAYEHVIDLVSGLLTHEFAQTQGLIIDLRNNGGGEITFGQEMIQLFSPQAVETELFRLRVTQANHDFLEESGWSDDFLKLLNNATPGSYYTDGATLTPPALANDRGQVYFKPVAILTNSSCFSTCDMFTAGMQDNNVAKIWSEDKNTGGGGANNEHYSTFIQGVPTTGKFTLPALPSGQDLGIAWRQAIRVGKNAGVLLEDKGVHADRSDDLPSSAEDLALNNLITVRTITSDLLLEGARRSGVIMFDDPATATTIDATEGAADAEVPVHLAGTTRVDFIFNEKALGSQAVDAAGSEPQAIVLRIPPPTGISEARIYLQGYLGNSPAWRKTLTYRIVPAPVAAPVAVALTGTAAPAGLAFYTPDSDPTLGWNMKSGQLQIGNGTQYADNLDTMASLFVSIPSPAPAGASTKLNYWAKIDTEQGFDFFTVSVAAKAGEAVLGTYSGSGADAPYTFDLGAYAGQTVEIRFHFVSDPGTHFSGVFLHDLSVE